MNGRLRFGGGAALLLAVLGQTGCGTVANLWLGVEGEATAYGHSWETRIYGGIQNDAHVFREALDGNEGILYSVLFLIGACIDLPLSLVADTLTLPYTIPCVLSRPDPNK